MKNPQLNLLASAAAILVASLAPLAPSAFGDDVPTATRVAHPITFSEETKTRQELVQVALGREPADLIIRGATVLVILGRADDARSLVAKAYSDHPDDRRLRNFTEMKGVDKIVADPSLKEVTP